MSEKEKMNTQNKKEISGFLKGVEIIGINCPILPCSFCF